MIIYYIIAMILIGLDQLSKYLTVQEIALGEVVSLVPNVLSLTYIRNSGAAWSILEDQMIFFYVITVVVVGALIYFLHTEGKKSPIASTGIAFIMGGAIGNFIDRLHLKYVIDMIRLEFINFPIFNVADMALTIGVIILIGYIVYDELVKKKVKGS
ncbi:signal peptidase II [Dolosigranulum pigrum]|uniref:Lipoprotein signal peptidase n=2 Tax=Dolosigranulum TaxID=29393 RepID=A0A328K776_9LACT|nr:signal peptidase II [Dolosigranulum pigrum]QDO91437.1 signal peptidase II [Dolosigranulum pigrum]QJS96491.1 signal peptidase II [Dolosigranulum pigrum]QJS98280.1 signal peptidase II [Dolosigranulum pigrum]QTJ34612.1 signal peptidase II [Dolosigranulum pigrum]QTJ39791.1 signal peptidase II [Dolosigranulum pigrum]